MNIPIPMKPFKYKFRRSFLHKLRPIKRLLSIKWPPLLKNSSSHTKVSHFRQCHFFEENSACMILLDPQSKQIIDANKAARNYFNWNPDRNKFQPLLVQDVFISFDDNDIYFSNNKYLILTHKNKDRHLREVETINTPIQINGRKIISSIVIDITDRLLAEEELYKRDRKIEKANIYMRNLFDSSLDPLMAINREAIVTDVNASAEKTIEVQRNKIVGSLWFTFFTDPAKAKEGFDQVWEQGFIINFPLTIKSSSGKLIDVLYNATTFRDDEGQPIGIFASARDITERKKIENDLRLAANVFNSSYDAILITDENNNILDVNPSFTRITGYTKDEVVGKNPRILSGGLHSKEFYNEMWTSIKKYDFWSGEIRNKRKNGDCYPELLSISTVKDKDKKISHYLAIFSDISLYKNQEEKLMKALQEAKVATIAKSQFLANMSHEIRTPMNGILGMAQLLSEQNLKIDERIEFAQTIINSGNVLLTLLNDILDISKVESGKIDLEKISFNPNQILQESTLLFSELAHKKQLSISSSWIGPKHFYLSDPIRIRQMLSNLINNAIKFTYQGAIKIHGRELKRENNKALLEFAVEDTGIGIPKDKISKLFTPFTQVDSSTARKFGGTGLGLSIIAQLSKLLGGNFGVESVLEKGSKFWFTVEVEIDTLMELNNPQSDPNSNEKINILNQTRSELTQNHHIFKVLVTDDDMINLKVIEKFLSKLGYQPLMAENGLMALELIKKNRDIDLVLMDLQMPELSGEETVQRIREWERETQKIPLPIVAFTADAFSETHQRCLQMGMNDILTKPVSVDALKKLLDRLLQNLQI